MRHRLGFGRLTIRGRLTLINGGVFLLAGVLLLAVTYLLVSHRLPGGVAGEEGRTGRQNSAVQGTGPEGLVAGQDPGSAPASPPASPPAGSVLTVTEFARDTRASALHSLLTQGGLALLLAASVATAAGWLLGGRLLRPLHRITETARRIADAPAADRGLHERIALAGPHDEIRELADTFDVMLERLDHSFDGQRRFIANASHELRTPLTLNRTLLEVALDLPTASAELRQLGSTLLAINARHGQLIDGLLLLARSEAEVPERSYVDLGDIVEHVAGQVASGTVAVHVEPGTAETTGNSVLLERLVQNLVENAVRHNRPEGGWVLIRSGTAADGSATVVVENTGPVVAPYDVPGLFEPFHRLAANRLATSPGAGLGLSIVRAIARAHQGTVQAAPREGGGLTLTVTLPAPTPTTLP